jgi:hypothetical protein
VLQKSSYSRKTVIRCLRFRPCAPGDHPEPERWEHLHVDQRMLHRLQIVPGQHPGEIGTADGKQRLETSV